MALFEASDLPVIATGIDSVIIFWSRGAADLFGWSAEEAMGQRSADLLGPAYADSASALMVPDATRWTGQLPVRRIDGATVLARSTSDAVRDHTGEVVGQIVLFSEVYSTQEARSATPGRV